MARRVVASNLLNSIIRSTQVGHEPISEVARPSMPAIARNSLRSCSKVCINLQIEP